MYSLLTLLVEHLILALMEIYHALYPYELFSFSATMKCYNIVIILFKFVSILYN